MTQKQIHALSGWQLKIECAKARGWSVEPLVGGSYALLRSGIQNYTCTSEASAWRSLPDSITNHLKLLDLLASRLHDTWHYPDLAVSTEETSLYIRHEVEELAEWQVSVWGAPSTALPRAIAEAFLIYNQKAITAKELVKP
jgi:hypothetical protein